MKKTLFSVLLAIVLVIPVFFAFSACKKKTEEKPQNTPSNIEEQQQEQQEQQQQETEYTIVLHSPIDMNNISRFVKTQVNGEYVYTRTYTASDSALVNDGAIYVNLSGHSNLHYYPTICTSANYAEDLGYYVVITPETIGNKEYWVKFTATIELYYGSFTNLDAFGTWATSIGAEPGQLEGNYTLKYVYGDDDIQLNDSIFNGFVWVPFDVDEGDFSHTFTTVQGGIQACIEAKDTSDVRSGHYEFTLVDTSID